MLNIKNLVERNISVPTERRGGSPRRIQRGMFCFAEQPWSHDLFRVVVVHLRNPKRLKTISGWHNVPTSTCLGIFGTSFSLTRGKSYIPPYCSFRSRRLLLACRALLKPSLSPPGDTTLSLATPILYHILIKKSMGSGFYLPDPMLPAMQFILLLLYFTSIEMGSGFFSSIFFTGKSI